MGENLTALEALGIAIAGGGIGTVLAVLIAYGAKLYAAWFEIWSHDRSVWEREQDLQSWVTDRAYRLSEQLDRITAEHNQHADGSGTSFHSGAHAKDLAAAKTQALHEYRDQERQLYRDVGRIRDTEDRKHLLWRLSIGRLFPEPVAPAVVQEVLDLWREDVTRHQGAPFAVRDPTRETFESEVAGLKSRPDAFASKPADQPPSVEADQD